MGGAPESLMSIDEVRDGAREILRQLSRAVIGYEEELRVLLACLLAGGHALLEGVPGIAKTTIARGLARVVGLTEDYAVIDGVRYKGFSRIQFTPDLMPSDVTGSLVFNPATREFEVKLGPIFAYVVLADEVNRATPRTQSAMLQAMQEREVTIGDRTYPLEVRSKGKFFFVIATQNPVEQEGTYPLPEAQLDRFAVRIIMPYPRSLEEEREIYKLHAYRLTEPVEDLEAVATPQWVVEAQEAVAKQVAVPEEILDYVARLVRATRPEVVEASSKYFELGASPRAGIALIRLAKAVAAMRGSEAVEASDVDEVLFHVLNHRVMPSIQAVVERGGTFNARIEVIREGLELARRVARGGAS